MFFSGTSVRSPCSSKYVAVIFCHLVNSGMAQNVFSGIDFFANLLYPQADLNWNSVSEARFLTADDSSAKAIRTAGSKAANCVKAVGNFCCLIG